MATKKAAVKKAAKKPIVNKTKAAATSNTKNKAAAPKTKREIDTNDLMAAVNKKLNANVVRRAATMETAYLLRRPTGITSLDIALNGGFPASAPIVLVGPDGAGKDMLLWYTCAEQQRIYGDDFRMVCFFTEFKPDKPFMRKCGLLVAMSDEEIAEHDKARVGAGFEPLTTEEKEELQTEIGRIYAIDGVTAEKGFDAVIDLVKSNTFQVAIINSVGNLQTQAKEDTDSFEDFAQQSNEAMLISKFMPKLSMTLNNDDNGRNETTLFIVNQVRTKRNKARVMAGRQHQDKDDYESASKAWALKHGKAIELMIHKGKKHYDEVEKIYIGRQVPWEITKGKLGTHDGVSGFFDFFYDTGVDVITDLVNTCQKYDVFTTNGSWIQYTDEVGEVVFYLQGGAKVRKWLMDHPEMVQPLRERCFHAAGVVYRHR